MNPLLKSLYDLTPVAAQNWLLTAFSAHLDRQRYGGRFPEFRTLMEDAQWWEAARIAEWQDVRLREVVGHAYLHVPYYRELFEERGLKPRDIQCRADLVKLPVLTRGTVKRRLPDMLSRAIPKYQLVEGHTSGTTGAPLTVFYNADMTNMAYAALDRHYRWAGVTMARGGDRVAVIRGNVIVPLGQRRPPFWRVNHLHNQLLLSCFHLTPENLTHYFQALREFKPAVLDGYPSSAYVLAKVLLNRGERLPLKAVITSSETLFDFQREVIEAAFQCRVFDYYAAAERVVFASECDHHLGHHLYEEYGITELLDEDDHPVPMGGEGYLVGTSLHNLGMPLLRYRTSDRSALKAVPCACGRPLPLMEDVATKAEDLLRLKDGRLISPSVLTHPFKPLDAIEASQLIQTDLDRLLIRLVPTRAYRQAHADHLVRELKARLGEEMRIDIELTDKLPRTANGKFKWVISEVDLGI
jgi:phenylacetate-CoA ligase